MKPAARIQATIDVLTRIEENTRVPMDSAIGDYMRQRRYIGSKDRANIAERCYHMARAYARLGWWLTKFEAADTPRNRILFWLLLAEVKGEDGRIEKYITDLFDGTKYSPEPLTPQELHYIKLVRQGNMIGGGLDHADMSEAIRSEVPEKYEAQLRAYFGKDFAVEMAAMLRTATLDLRVNTHLIDRENAQKSLNKDDVETDLGTYAETALRCVEKAFISRTKAFTKGWVEIQDEGSQLIAELCGAQPGMQVLDYCAGAGGKTLALGAAMKCKGRIVAMDNDSRRLQKGRDRYKKARIADIVEVRSLEDEKNRKWVKRQKGKFDIVLTDVPCTGTGTWRRNPDMRWRQFGPVLEELLVT
ncbi:MAG: RsmB/NOP family class I SAM-dependent RNA methyltransferase, partial [Alphaproteobacteria bacterium]